jgi:hypothetical protein
MAIVEILSKHAQDEEYIGESFIEGWTDNKQVLNLVLPPSNEPMTTC